MTDSRVDKEFRFTLLANPHSKLISEEIEPVIPGIEIVQGENIDASRFLSTDIFLVDCVDPEWALEQIKALRKDENHVIKPVGALSQEPLNGQGDLIDEPLLLSADRAQILRQIENLKKISAEMVQFPVLPERIEANKRKEILVLHYLAARAGGRYALRPKPDISSSTGYIYPLLAHFLEYPSAQAHEMLDNWEKAKLLQGDVVDRINLCPHCHRYNLNFREVCPQCESGRIQEESTIHHFSCGYIGFERDFTQGMKWICPKCGKDLRHIGVDYDKPVDNIWCSDCHANFSEPAVQCFCLHCQQVSPPSDLIVRPVAQYYLTNVGLRYARNGVLPEFGFIDLLKDDFNLYDAKVFREFLRVETMRCRRYKYQSSLMLLQVENFGELWIQQGLDFVTKLRKEFIDLLKRELRTTDLLSALGGNEIALLLTHTPVQQTDLIFDRLRRYFDSVFEHRLRLQCDRYDLSEQASDLERFLTNDSRPASESN
ncbi:MAG TPA: diguanylate cyclase [bacterium]|nr:diguanylate cyclase [bacterium]